MKHKKAYHILRQWLQGSLSTEHQKITKDWLTDKKEADIKDAAVRQIWDETDAVADDSTEWSLQATHLKIKAAEKKTFRINQAKKLLRYAAIFMLPIISGLAVWISTSEKPATAEMITCYVPNGEQLVVELPDGSNAQINSGSIFIYPKEFTQKKREVYLVGEANFSVTKDEDKPFIVQIKSLQVEVVGTKFNVESYPESDRIITTLEQGAVIVHETGEKQQDIRMQPDEQLVYYEKEARFEKKYVNAASYGAWTHGELYFNNQSMYDIINTFERHYNVQIQIDPQIICTDLYTMRIRSHETLENALYILTQIAGNNLTFQQKQDRVYLFPRRKEVSL